MFIILNTDQVGTRLGEFITYRYNLKARKKLGEFINLIVKRNGVSHKIEGSFERTRNRVFSKDPYQRISPLSLIGHILYGQYDWL